MAPARLLEAHELRDVRECHDCGLFQRVVRVPDGAVAACGRCGATLRRKSEGSLAPALACAGAAALLFTYALFAPLLHISAAGHVVGATMFTGPAILAERGVGPLAFVVVATLIVLPALRSTVLGAVLVAALRGGAPAWARWLFAWYERLTRWAMVEVFLLGAAVAYTRLRDLASVEVGSGIVALFGVMLASVAGDATLDREEVWARLDPGAPASLPGHATDPEAAPIACHHCHLVQRSPAGSRCARCLHALHARRTDPLLRPWAFLVAGVALYVPANVLPVMTVTRLGRGGPNTILSGVAELAEAHLWPLAVLVFLASFVVPLFKIVALASMLVLTHRRSPARLEARTRVFRVIDAIGRWSMIDIFMLTTLVAVVRLGFLAEVVPGAGAAAFCAVVVLTMLATESFDARAMWDAAGANDVAPLRRTAMGAR